MRILDKDDNELQESEIDNELGHLEEEEIIIQHHDAIEGQEEISKYWPQTYHFTDGTSYTVQGFDDPHVVEIKREGTDSLFKWHNLEDEEEKEVFGVSVVPYTIQEAIYPQEAWDETEGILRYIEYTPEELKERAAEQAKKEKEQAFIENGPDMLEETNATVEDLVLMMADIIGGAEEEEEE